MSQERTDKVHAWRSSVAKAAHESLGGFGIPADWLRVETLSGVQGAGREGLHVQFVVHAGGEQLLARHEAIEQAFVRALRQADPRSAEWLMTRSWVFAPGCGLPTHRQDWVLETTSIK